MHMEWSEEKILKGIVGDKTRLRFWNKHQKIEILFTQLARYNKMPWNSVEILANKLKSIKT